MRSTPELLRCYASVNSITRAIGTGTGYSRQHIIHKAIIKGMNAVDSIGPYAEVSFSSFSLLDGERLAMCVIQLSCGPGGSPDI